MNKELYEIARVCLKGGCRGEKCVYFDRPGDARDCTYEVTELFFKDFESSKAALLQALEFRLDGALQAEDAAFQYGDKEMELMWTFRADAFQEAIDLIKLHLGGGEPNVQQIQEGQTSGDETAVETEKV